MKINPADIQQAKSTTAPGAAPKKASEATASAETNSLAFDIAGLLDPLVNHVAVGSLFGRLVIDRIAQVRRDDRGFFEGDNTFNLFYAPISDFQSATRGQRLGEWVYSEWSRKHVTQTLDTGEAIAGSRIVVAMGAILKSGNSSEIEFQRLGVGLVQDHTHEKSLVSQSINFVGAVNCQGKRTVTSACEEAEFFSAVSGWLTNREGFLSHAQHRMPGAQQKGS